ncbi:hypothetical protein CRG98_032542 [Punica granatum]|uniref:Uncharacterized protein n=1 Tax=Punica granatum TaxID=22663 RepID=A0A2I0IUH4_PUNGR|nr:hypothetical protein CRG98_032542 [Punica granatum]
MAIIDTAVRILSIRSHGISVILRDFTLFPHLQLLPPVPSLISRETESISPAKNSLSFPEKMDLWKQMRFFAFMLFVYAATMDPKLPNSNQIARFKPSWDIDAYIIAA